MRTDLYWFAEIPANGRLGICPRPRGGEWLEDELQHFRRSGVEFLVSALTRAEERELELLQESVVWEQSGGSFVAFPIEDRCVPDSLRSFYECTKALALALSQGRNIVVHCRQGIGRSALLAAGILRFMYPRSAASAADIFGWIGAARGREVPDTREQVHWFEMWSELFF